MNPAFQKAVLSFIAWGLCFQGLNALPAAEPVLVGHHSCATATCHGNVVDQGPTWNHSLSVFFAKDPHAHAGQVLYGQQSQAIVSRIKRSATPDSQLYQRILRERCISCHLTATADDCRGDHPIDPKRIAAGVSCESCHGPASDWLDEHLKVSFDQDRLLERSSMRDTESVLGRAQTCVRCHIGDRRGDGVVRDVNHDLIAAGHPALRFSLLTYSDSLPKHWNQTSDQQLNESRLRSFEASRSIGLAAAAELASQRAKDFIADRRVPWPEFSDYDCFACHQSLTTHRARTSLLKISLGLPIWNPWHSVDQVEMHDNRDRLIKLAPHRSDPKNISVIGAKLSEIFQEKAIETMQRPGNAKEELIQIVKTRNQEPPFDWHHAAIDYLRMRAIVDDSKHLSTDPDVLRKLQELESLLRFNPDAAMAESSYFNSPNAFDPNAIQSVVTELARLLISDPRTSASK